MGYMKHEALVIVSNERDAEAIHSFRAQMPDEFKHLLVGPVGGVNGLDAWCFLPDGSKEGWDHSNRAHELRDFLIATMRDKTFADWSYVEFAGDDELKKHITSEDD